MAIGLLAMLADTEYYFYLCSSGRMKEALNYIRSDPKDKLDSLVNARDEEQNTLLHWAAQLGSVEGVRFLLQNGSEVNAKNQHLETPLHHAALKGHVPVIQELVRAGAVLDVHSLHGLSPFTAAVQEQHILATYYIYSVLQSTSKKILIDDLVDSRGRTVMHWAAYRNNPALFYFGLSHGADVNARDKNGSTPLHIASKHGDEIFIRLLLTNSANIRGKDKTYKTALDIAREHGSEHVINTLLQHQEKFRWDNSYPGTVINHLSQLPLIFLTIMVIFYYSLFGGIVSFLVAYVVFFVRGNYSGIHWMAFLINFSIPTAMFYFFPAIRKNVTQNSTEFFTFTTSLLLEWMMYWKLCTCDPGIVTGNIPEHKEVLEMLFTTENYLEDYKFCPSCCFSF
eukprot:TRINITY_DN7918_c0_g1_i5.p1 TRINITY_DN7918_c0_g1~~TRINITY_DN7918_c0_g1_i5.p1  ORF type:complete len:396 (-),score=60.47 TRINITY_DN7918_c0_g1_i5:115-1302(-)